MADNSTEYLLRLEIARLLRKQREVQLREFDSPAVRALEFGAQSKAQAEMLAAQVLVFINDPLANETVRAQLANLQQYVDMCKQTAASMAQGSMTALSMQAAKAKSLASDVASGYVTAVAGGGGGGAAAASADAEVRSLTKIEMLEAQLADLKRMLEMQQAAASAMQQPAPAARLSASMPTPKMSMSSAASVTSMALSERRLPTVAESPVAPGSASAAATPRRPKMTDLIAQSRGIQLRKVSANAHAGCGMRQVPAADADGLTGVLRRAFDQRFMHMHAAAGVARVGTFASPASSMSSISSTASSPYASPGSPQAAGAVRRRLSATSASVAAAAAARRISRGRTSVGSASVVASPNAFGSPSDMNTATRSRMAAAAAASSCALTSPSTQRKSFLPAGSIPTASGQGATAGNMDDSVFSGVSTPSVYGEDVSRTPLSAAANVHSATSGSMLPVRRLELASPTHAPAGVASQGRPPLSPQPTMPTRAAGLVDASPATAGSLPVRPSAPASLLAGIQGFNKRALARVEADAPPMAGAASIASAENSSASGGASAGASAGAASAPRNPMLAAIQGFKREKLAHVEPSADGKHASAGALAAGRAALKPSTATNSGAAATTTAAKPAAPAGFNPAMVLSVSLRKTGAKLS